MSTMIYARRLLSIALAISFAAVSSVSAQAIFDATLTEDVETVRIVASGRRYSPRQSVAPGGTPRHTANYDIEVIWNPDQQRAREEWTQQNLYPVEIELPFAMPGKRVCRCA